jgi:hypothetical protein
MLLPPLVRDLLLILWGVGGVGDPAPRVISG